MAASLLQETPSQVFPCKYCEIDKNSLFYGTPPMATSELAKTV